MALKLSSSIFRQFIQTQSAACSSASAPTYSRFIQRSHPSASRFCSLSRSPALSRNFTTSFPARAPSYAGVYKSGSSSSSSSAFKPGMKVARLPSKSAKPRKKNLKTALAIKQRDSSPKLKMKTHTGAAKRFKLVKEYEHSSMIGMTILRKRGHHQRRVRLDTYRAKAASHRLVEVTEPYHIKRVKLLMPYWKKHLRHVTRY